MGVPEFACTLPCAAAVALLSSSLLWQSNFLENYISFKKQLYFPSHWKDPNRRSVGIFPPHKFNTSLILTAPPCTYSGFPSPPSSSSPASLPL